MVWFYTTRLSGSPLTRKLPPPPVGSSSRTNGRSFRLSHILFVELVHPAGTDVVVVSEASAEDARNMHEFVNQGFGLLGLGETVVIFRDEFDHVVGLNRKAGLNRLRKTMAAGENPAAFGPAATDRADAFGVHMIPLKRSDDPSEFLIDVRC
jgi:hypothetical protein